ncbi:MAG: aspartate/glutamate racemase family protein [Candidatus Limnocylindrales bacterium]
MTYWIGRIEPSMWFEGAWWEEMLPSDVRLAVLSLGVGRLTPEQLELAHSQILEKVDVLEREGVDVINVGGSPVVTAYGMAGHARLVDEIAARVSRPFVTALQAELEGISAVGARRVAIASPYPAAQTLRRVGILEEEGFEVVAHDSMNIERNRDITTLDPRDVLEQAVRLAEANPSAETIYLPCGSLPVISIIDELESRTGLPVVACAQAQLAACLKRIDYATPIEGFGRLLRERTPIPA